MWTARSTRPSCTAGPWLGTGSRKCPEDPYTDPVTGVLRNKLGLGTAKELATAEREITRVALILIRESPARATCDLPRTAWCSRAFSCAGRSRAGPADHVA
jgi:hypothetical protein